MFKGHTPGLWKAITPTTFLPKITTEAGNANARLAAAAPALLAFAEKVALCENEDEAEANERESIGDDAQDTLNSLIRWARELTGITEPETASDPDYIEPERPTCTKTGQHHDTGRGVCCDCGALVGASLRTEG